MDFLLVVGDLLEFRFFSPLAPLSVLLQPRTFFASSAKEIYPGDNPAPWKWAWEAEPTFLSHLWMCIASLPCVTVNSAIHCVSYVCSTCTGLNAAFVWFHINRSHLWICVLLFFPFLIICCPCCSESRLSVQDLHLVPVLLRSCYADISQLHDSVRIPPHLQNSLDTYILKPEYKPWSFLNHGLFWLRWGVNPQQFTNART